MGLFKNKKEICSICGINDGKEKIMDGYICKDCLENCGKFISLPFRNLTAEEFRKAQEMEKENKKLLQNFIVTNKVDKYFEMDSNNRLWRIPDGLGGKIINPIIFTFDDILNYELLEDGETIRKGSLGKAVVGGAVFGIAGAIVGGASGKNKTIINKLEIKIVTKKMIRPDVYIYLLTMGSVKKGSVSYEMAINSAQKIMSLLDNIKGSDNIQNNNQNISAADEILKYKQLQEQGIITEQEFNEKKKQLLGL